MSLKNIKATLIFEQDLKRGGEKFKINNVSFTIYKYKSDRIHITGVKSIKELEYYKYVMENKYEQKVIQERIDNMFYSKKNDINIDLDKLYYYMQNSDVYFANYNVERFCGMFLEPYNNNNKCTILLFRTGSYTFLGMKAMEEIEENIKFVNMLLQKFAFCPKNEYP